MQRAFIVGPGGARDRLRPRSRRPHRSRAGGVGVGGGTTGEIIEAGNIREDLFGLILEADVVICDVTIHNANVVYELGIRHALRKRRTVLIRGVPAADETPFDNLTDRYLSYYIDEPRSALQQLTDTLVATLASERIDSPIFIMLPPEK